MSARDDLARLIARQARETVIVDGVVTAAKAGGMATVRTPMGDVRVVAWLATLTTGYQVRLIYQAGKWALLHQVDTDAPAMASSSIVLNGAFNTDLTGWLQIGNGALSWSATGGTGNAQGAALNTNVANLDSAVVSDPIYAMPRVYTAAVWYGATVAGNRLDLELWSAPSVAGCVPGGPGFIRTVVATVNPMPAAQFANALRSGPVTVLPSARVVRIAAHLTGTTALAQTVYLDEFSLT